MMRVIVHEQETLALIFDFKTPARVLETAERSGDSGKWNSQLRGERDNAKRVTHVVASGHVEHRLAQPFASMIDAKDRRKILQIDIGAAIIRLWGKAKRNGTGPRPARTPPAS